MTHISAGDMSETVQRMKSYRVLQPCSREHHDAVLGTVSAEFEPGEVTPKNETEEAALEALVLDGLVERLPDKASGKKENTK